MVNRVAIVSSPRSGNTWLRHMLRDGLGLPELAVHNYTDLPSIPDRCVLQVHWYREPNFQRFLASHGFRVITLARHPLDTLVSVLHFIKREPATSEWLGGNCGIPSELVGKPASSREFLDYALSFGSENLLSVSYQWWHDPGAIKVRYEDLVHNGSAAIANVAIQLGLESSDLLVAYGATSFATLQNTDNRHGWQGRTGLWRELIPETHAFQITNRHRHLIEILGYSIEGTGLTEEQAEANWNLLSR